MSGDEKVRAFIVDVASLPTDYPTHRHSSPFWEALGRNVATFGFLEETLSKAIFAFTATRHFEPDKIEEAYEHWLTTLERTIADPLGSLIGTYEKAVRDHGAATVGDFPKIIGQLRQACTLRNVLCHGSWRAPDDNRRSVPFFVNKKMKSSKIRSI